MASKIQLAIAGKIRNKSLSQDYLDKLTRILEQTDPKLGARILSGGQDRKGKGRRRKGSTRHDVNAHGVGETADLVLTYDGKEIEPGQNKALYSAFLQNAATEFPGIGHYAWGVHVGGGNKAAWGPTKRSASLDPEFRTAIQKGWQGLRTNSTTPVLQTVSNVLDREAQGSAGTGVKQASVSAGAIPSTTDDPILGLINALMGQRPESAGVMELNQAVKTVDAARGAGLDSLMEALGMPIKSGEAGSTGIDKNADSNAGAGTNAGISVGTGNDSSDDDFAISDGMAFAAGLGATFLELLKGFGDNSGSSSSVRSIMNSGIPVSPSVAQILSRTGVR